MGVDESFGQPGAVPFKWEIRPGVPKAPHRHHQRSSTNPPQKLRPPPSSPLYSFLSPPELRTDSFRSAPRSRSDRWIFDRPEVVSVGCFTGPLMGRKDTKKRLAKLPEPMFNLDTGKLPGRSVSARGSRSPFLPSPASSYSSFQSSPRPIKDSDWAGFGLF